MISLALLLLGANPTLADAFARLPARHGESVAPAAGKTVTLDEKNGFLHIIEKNKDGDQIDSTFALFLTSTRERIYGYRFYSHPGSGSDAKEVLVVGFFREDDGKFADVTSEVLPSTTFSDYWPQKFMVPVDCGDLDVELPQKGTTIVVSAPMTQACFPGSSGGANEVQEWGDGIKARSRKFVWNPKKEVFLKAK